MPIEAEGRVTTLLREIADGNEAAKQALFAHVYDELKKMAYGRMKNERLGHSWGATVLVNEVYIRLMKDQRVFTKNRPYFFGAAAEAMYQLLREHARKRNRQRQVCLDPTLLDQLIEETERNLAGDVLDLMEALDELEAIGDDGKRQHHVVVLHYWGGLTYEHIAKYLRVSVATVNRDWRAAKAWLYKRLKGR
jgi:RNA polymerase sigma factor (TIGR02999 family)